jgi:hypothetical protein
LPRKYFRLIRWIRQWRLWQLFRRLPAIRLWPSFLQLFQRRQLRPL